MNVIKKLYKKLHRSVKSTVTIGNGEQIPTKGKGHVTIESYKERKLIYEVLFVPELYQN